MNPHTMVTIKIKTQYAANDTIRCAVTVKSSRRSKSKPFGVTTILIEVFNQKKELVADMTAVWLLKIGISNK